MSNKVISKTEGNAFLATGITPTNKLDASITLDKLLEIFTLNRIGDLSNSQFNSALRTGEIKPAVINRRNLEGTSLTKNTDMSNALCLADGDEPVGIRVCMKPSVSPSGAPEFDSTTNEAIQKIVGLQMIYGYVGPRCSWTPNTTADNGGFKFGVEHGNMNSINGTCQEYYFDGKEIVSLSVYGDYSSNRFPEVQGIKLVKRKPVSTDQRRMLQGFEVESYDTAIDIGSTTSPKQTYQRYAFSDANKWFGFTSSLTLVS